MLPKPLVNPWLLAGLIGFVPHLVAVLVATYRKRPVLAALQLFQIPDQGKRQRITALNVPRG
jgi:uncharacterized membrane protein